MIADLISNVTPKGPMMKDIKSACFLNFKLLISENLTYFHDEKILYLDGNVSISANCRISSVVWIVKV